MIGFIVEHDGRVRRVELDVLPITIGRDAGAPLTIDDPLCSREHARISETPEGMVLRDLDSRNGTLLNGEPVQQALLKRGDHVRIGGADITFLGVDRSSHAPSGGADVPGIETKEHLGDGVLSHVMAAHQTALHRPVALKILRDEWRGSDEQSARFGELLRRQSRISHPALASVIEMRSQGEVPCAVVERVEGVPVGDLVAAHGALEPARAAAVLRQVLELMQHVHGKGSRVEWLSPGRVLVGPDDAVKVTALGAPLARFDDLPEGRHGDLCWLPPERAARPGDGGVAGDLFQAGALAWHLLVGRPPREAGSRAEMLEGIGERDVPPPEGVPGLAPALRSLVADLCARDPAGRPADAGEALRRLDAVQDKGRDLKERARPAREAAAGAEKPSGEKGDKPVVIKSERFKTLSALITIGIIVVVNVIVFVVYRAFDDDIRSFLWGHGSDDEEETSGVAEGSPPPPPDAGGDGNGDTAGAGATGGGPGAPRVPKPDRAAVKLRWEGLQQEVAGLRASERHMEAVEALESFVAENDGTSEASAARALLKRVSDQWVAKVQRLLNGLEVAIRRGDAEAAWRARREAVAAGGGSAFPERLAALTTSLEELVASARKPERPESRPGEGGGEAGGTAAGASEGGPADPEPEPEPGGVPRRDWPAALERALADMGRRGLRRRLLESLAEEGSPGPLAPGFRLLEAQEAVADRVVAFLNKQAGSDLELRLQGRGPVAGRPGAVREDGFDLETAGGRIAVRFDELGHRGWLGLVGRLEADLDGYLVRAKLHQQVGRPADAWFDLHGARILAGENDAVRQLVDRWLEELAARKDKGTGDVGR